MEISEMNSVINLFNYYKTAAQIPDSVWNEDRLLHTLREYNIRPNLFFQVAFNGLRPVGVIGGFLSEDPVESTVTATIQFNYLLDEYATVENYAQLIGSFESWAKQFKISQMRAIDIGQNYTRLNDIYDVLGFDSVKVTVMNKEIE
jgi:hypothetical protein